MKKSTAFILSILTLFSFFVLLKDFFPVSSTGSVDTIVVVGEFYSQISLIPATVEAGQQSSVSIAVLDSEGDPIPGRIIEIYDEGGSPFLLVVQPSLPSDGDGNTGGYVGSFNPGTYSVCVKDVTEGTGTVIAICKPLTVIPLPPPTMGPEPEYTQGDTNTISWTTNGSRVYEYELEVSTDENFTNVVDSSGWIGDTSYTATDLSDTQRYFYRVRARNNGGGVSEWSQPVSSIQDASGPRIIFVGSSSLPSGTTVEEYDSNATFTLTYTLSDPNGVGPRILSVILLDGTRANIPYTATFDGTNWVSTIKIGDLPKDNGVNLYPAYSFYLEVRDNFGNTSGNGQGNVVIPPKIIIPPVTPPVVPPVVPPVEPPVSPPKDEMPYTIPGIPVQVSTNEEQNPTFTWVPSYNNVTGNIAPGYQIQWCENRNFLNCSMNILRTNSNGATIEDTLDFGNWYVRVRAFNRITLYQGDWSNTGTFTIKESLPPIEPPFKPPVEEPEEEESLINKVTDNIGKVISQVGEAIGKLNPQLRTATTVGVLLANAIAGMNVVLNMLSSVPYILSQISIAFLSLLGFRKKGVFSGYIYDSITKEPIGQAIIRVFTESNVLIWTDVSDSRGRYKTPELDNGNYYIKVTAQNYSYPSKVIVGANDYPLENVYGGSIFTVKKGLASDFSIPLDSVKATKAQRIGERLVTSTKWMWKIAHSLLFAIGLVFSIYALKSNPVWWNYLIILLYVPSLFLLIKLFFGKKDEYGIVKDERGNPLKDITIYLSDIEFDKVIFTRVTGVNGRYRFLVSPGNYTISIGSSEYILLESEKYQNIKVGGSDTELLCPNLIVKRKE